jgi:hypothetical protein
MGSLRIFSHWGEANSLRFRFAFFFEKNFAFASLSHSTFRENLDPCLDYENITPYYNFVGSFFQISKIIFQKFSFSKNWCRPKVIFCNNACKTANNSAKQWEYTTFELSFHKLVKILNKVISLSKFVGISLFWWPLVTSGDLGWALIPIVTILKIISDLLTLIRAQNHDCTSKYTKKNITLRFIFHLLPWFWLQKLKN